MRVLVIEDDDDIRDLVSFTLAAQDHEVHGAVDGLHGWARLSSEPFDVAVVDRMMPGRDGISLVTACRADETLRDLPIVMLTARARPDEVEEGLEAGASAYMTKPFSPKALAEVVRSVTADLT